MISSTCAYVASHSVQKDAIMRSGALTCARPSMALALCRYGGEHRAPELQKEAVYGLTELHREEVKKARLVANPGCYPTTVQLPLCPLLEVSLQEPLFQAWLSPSSLAFCAGQSRLLYVSLYVKDACYPRHC